MPQRDLSYTLTETIHAHNEKIGQPSISCIMTYLVSMVLNRSPMFKGAKYLGNYTKFLFLAINLGFQVTK